MHFLQNVVWLRSRPGSDPVSPSIPALLQIIPASHWLCNRGPWVFIFTVLFTEVCLSPFSLCLCFSRPLQDGDIINIDVTVSKSYKKNHLWSTSESLVATGRRVAWNCGLARARECCLLPALDRSSWFPFLSLTLCLFQGNLGLTCISGWNQMHWDQCWPKWNVSPILLCVTVLRRCNCYWSTV